MVLLLDSHFSSTIKEVNMLFYVWVGTDSPYQNVWTFYWQVGIQSKWKAISTVSKKQRQQPITSDCNLIQSKEPLASQFSSVHFLRDKYWDATQMVKEINLFVGWLYSDPVWEDFWWFYVILCFVRISRIVYPACHA